MKTQTRQIKIKGMHCRSCEILIEDELSQVNGITKVDADQKSSAARITYQGQLNEKQVALAIKKAGYELAESATDESLQLIDLDKNKIINLLVAGVVVFVSGWLLQKSGWLNKALASTSGAPSLSVAFIIGLTAGLSTCMALVGGLVLAASAKFAQSHPQATVQEKLIPQLMFNLGRVIGFFILGGILGLMGSALQLSLTFTGLLTISVGLVMLVLGGQLLNIFPWLNQFKLTLPKQITRQLNLTKSNQSYSHPRTLLLGGLTFFLPCGFTQAMQLAAINSGSFTQGSLLMGAFAIGTAVGLILIGVVSSFIKGKVAQLFFMISGLIVIILAALNILNGLNLLGLPVPNLFRVASIQGQVLGNNESLSGEQIITMTQNRAGYQPNSFTVKKNRPVKWVINSIDSYSCASSLVVPKLNVKQFLQAGENVIKFTPTESGTIKFSCGMGMYSGLIKVTD